LRAPTTRSADHDAVASDPLRAQLQTTLGTAYTLERELGGGEMSRVFVAHNTTLERNVVVKVLSPELAAGVSAEQFTREIKLAAGLQQANIVPLLSAGETDGLPFYTMPFVDGMSLRARLERNGAMPTAEAVSELRDVARALAYAHERGVVHRDIKPENILLSGEAAVVTDFGIAKALSASRTVAPGGTLTQVGTSIGARLQAPEQAAADPDTDHRADLYALGCVAYEMLTGGAPFAGRPVHQLFAAHLNETPAPIAHGIASISTIAVLPFGNTGDDPKDEYFSDGMTDELAHALSRVPGLRLAGRTSSFAFKGKNVPAQEIGRTLGVAGLVEGTVRRAGDRLRITAQLTSTDDGKVLWSDTYERSAGDVFAVQDELTRAIVAALTPTLRGAPAAQVTGASRGTEDAEAYDLYLRGRYFWSMRGAENLVRAASYFRRAVQKDPRFARAHAGLAMTYRCPPLLHARSGGHPRAARNRQCHACHGARFHARRRRAPRSRECSLHE
jgi:eukaryotic-like serine/threonine-protein kinase